MQVEYALVTVRVEKLNWQADMELPARMRIRDLLVKMLETLKMYDEDCFSHISQIRLYYQGRELHGSASLADYQIWDGSVLDIRC